MNSRSLIYWREKSQASWTQAALCERFFGLRREMNRLFDDFSKAFGGDVPPRILADRRRTTPAIGVVENDEHVVVTAELPGLDEQDFEVTLAGDVLTIRGGAQHPDKPNNSAQHRAEHRFGAFSRSVCLPFAVGSGEVEARYGKGLLTVRVPKPADVRQAPRRIPIDGVKMEIAELKRAVERQQLLIAELDHRMRNTLARMSLIIEHSRRRAGSVDALAAAISSQLDALVRAHARFNQTQLIGTRLKELVEDELAPYRSRAKVSVEGSDLPLNPQAAQALAMVLHELVTNAVKHGALSAADGRVVVRWQIAGEISSAQLNLVWQEADGPSIDRQTRRGFGTRLINNVVHHELGGRVELRLLPAGARCEIDLPLARVAGKTH